MIDVREERPGDADAIRALTTAAFAGLRHSSGTEAAIIDGLRAADALSLSLVASAEDRIVGHLAFSSVTIDGSRSDWLGLGPVSVAPTHQRSGIGSALIRQGLALVAARGTGGCVLLGDPAYYVRFGFANDPALTYRDVPPPWFQRLALGGAPLKGRVEYHPAFDLSAA